VVPWNKLYVVGVSGMQTATEVEVTRFTTSRRMEVPLPLQKWGTLSSYVIIYVLLYANVLLLVFILMLIKLVLILVISLMRTLLAPNANMGLPVLPFGVMNAGTGTRCARIN
jgi:hypothetical protein